MDEPKDPAKSLAETLASLNESLKPFRELSERAKKIAEPYQRLAKAFQPFTQSLQSLRPFTQSLQSLHPLTRVNQHRHNGLDVPDAYLVPQPSTPPIVTSKPHPEKRPSTLDKDADRREIYAQVVREMGKYCQRGLLEREAAKRAGCSERTIREALKGKK